MSGSKGFAGVYETLSRQKSTEEHKALSASLRKAMRERGFFETEAMGTRRKEVVKTITKVCEDWIREILLAEPMHASKDPCEQFQLRVYGSYRLDAHLPNADIDSVVIVSRFIDRDTHFPELFKHFEAMQRTHPDRLESLKFITAARVPIISFFLDGIDIDIGFSQTNLNALDADFIACDAVLENMDKRCKTSINGLRVTDAIASLLPQRPFDANIDVFRTVIRFLKHWAKRRCVYGNKEGLLMGVALEIMLVLVCQLYPNHSEFDILHNFFHVFAKWPWADEHKGIVNIKELHEVKRSEDAYEYGGPWSKESPICRRQAMKIITPCYPQANTTSKVSGLQLLAIKTELFRGLAITQSIVDAKGSVPIEHALDRLLSPFSFFDRYTHFIMVTASAESKDAFTALKEDVGISIAGGRNNLIQLMEAEKGTHVDIAHPLPVWVLDRGVAADTPASADSTSDVSSVGVKRERSASDATDMSTSGASAAVSCANADGDLIDSVGSENPLDRLKRADPLKALYFVGLSLKDECKVCRAGTPSPGAFFKCPIKDLLEKPGKRTDMPFDGALADRPCKICGKKYRSHDLKIKDLGFEFDKVCEKYLNQMSARRSKMRGQNVSIAVLRTSHEFLEYAWVKCSDEIQNYCKDLGELKDGDVGDSEESAQDLPCDHPQAPTLSPPQPPSEVARAAAAGGGTALPLPSIDATKDKDAGSGTVVFKLKPNQELRFEVKADSNQQARRATATLILQQGGLAEICGAELAAGREYVFRNAALIGVFTYFGCTLSLSGSYHVVEPDAISQPVPMSFMACLHAQAQQAREAAAAPATAAAAASAPAARPRPPRIMIAGGEKSGKTSVAKILGNYAVRIGQKPLLVDLDCAGGFSNVPGSICAATLTRIIPPVSSGVSQPWHRSPMSLFVGNEKPDLDPDAFLKAVTSLSISIEKRMASLQGIDPVAAASGLIVDTFRCDDYETSATLLVNAAIALSITTLVLTKDDMHMVSIIRSKAPDIKVVTLPPFTEFKRRMGKASDSWAIFSELKVQSYFRGDYEMSLEPEVGFTLSGDALWKCGFYHVLPPQKLRVSQGALPIGEKASDKSDAVVEKRKPSADMTGRVMALLHCEDGFVVTSENYCRIPVLGYVHVRSFKGGKLELTKPASSFMSKHPTFVFGGLNFSES